MSRVLLIEPGATYSITEVVHGVEKGLRDCGHEVDSFDTLGQLLLASERVQWTLKKAGMADAIPHDKRRWPWPRKESSAEVVESYFDAVREEGFKAAIWHALDEDYDWMVLVSALLAPTRALLALRRAGVRSLMVFTESPYDDPIQARLAEYATAAVTNDRKSAEGMGLGYMPMAYCDDLHQPRESEPTSPAHDVVFVGVGFPERIAVLESVDWSGIDLGLYGDWKLLPRSSPLRRYVHQGILDNAEAVDLYKRSLVGLNLHRMTTDYWGDRMTYAVGGWSCNPRTYELAACGVPQITDWRPGLVDVFGGELAHTMSVDTPQSLGDNIRRLLGNAQARVTLACRQQEAVLGWHSYRNRAETLSAIMEETA